MAWLLTVLYSIPNYYSIVPSQSHRENKINCTLRVVDRAWQFYKEVEREQVLSILLLPGSINLFFFFLVWH